MGHSKVMKQRAHSLCPALCCLSPIFIGFNDGSLSVSQIREHGIFEGRSLD